MKFLWLLATGLLSSTLMAQDGCDSLVEETRLLLRDNGRTGDLISVTRAKNLKYQIQPRSFGIVPDFSFAGYMGGGVPLPVTKIVATLKPGSDDATTIQNAINTHGAKGGGTIYLTAGNYKISKPISINYSNIILRGTGVQSGETTLTIAQNFEGSVFRIGGPSKGVKETNTTLAKGDYYPGETQIEVDSSVNFKKGDLIFIRKTVTQKWVEFMEMHQLKRDNELQTWLGVGSFLDAHRTITNVSGNVISFEPALSDSYLVGHSGRTKVVRYEAPNQISGVGIESMRFAAPANPMTKNDKYFQLFNLDQVKDSWIRHVKAFHFANVLSTSSNAKRVTIENIHLYTNREWFDGKHGALPIHINLNGTQILLKNSSVTSNLAIAVGTGRNGQMNVVLDVKAVGKEMYIQTHQRWATGLLVDRPIIASGEVQFKNRMTNGSGHGWSVGSAMSWNATKSNIDQPPSIENWSVPHLSNNQSSLYFTQLCKRKGIEAVSAIRPSIGK